jgi:HK97 family phage prohead protease
MLKHIDAKVRELISQYPELRAALGSLPGQGVEYRAIDSEVRTVGNAKIEGYAAVFSRDSLPIMGFFTEEVMPGAFTETITQDDIRGLIDHDAHYILGRNKAGTMRLSEDSRGLQYSIDLGPQSYAKDLYESVKRGDVTQSSFGFRTVSDKWMTKDEMDHRQLVKVKLFDVSPVTFPAYTQTEVVARNVDARAMTALMKVSRKISLTEDDLTAVEGAVVAMRGPLPDPASVVSGMGTASRRLRLAESEK